MKKNIDITHLVTNGCSWTYCQGLDNPELDGWPRLLADKLGIKVVNLALPGCGNQSIQRRTYEYVLKNLPTNSKPFFAIGWSQYWRQEKWDNSINDYHLIIGPDNSKKLTIDQEYVLDTWSDEDHFRRTLINKSSVKSLFNSLNIPYIMGDFSSCLDVIDNKLKEKVISLTNFTNDEYHTDSFCHLCYGVPLTACKHYGIEGQHIVANYLYTKINSLYNINIINDATFVSLKNFSIQNYFESCWDYF